MAMPRRSRSGRFVRSSAIVRHSGGSRSSRPQIITVRPVVSKPSRARRAGRAVARGFGSITSDPRLKVALGAWLLGEAQKRGFLNSIPKILPNAGILTNAVAIAWLAEKFFHVKWPAIVNDAITAGVGIAGFTFGSTGAIVGDDLLGQGSSAYYPGGFVAY